LVQAVGQAMGVKFDTGKTARAAWAA
jgi:hypothetical protein